MSTTLIVLLVSTPIEHKPSSSSASYHFTGYHLVHSHISGDNWQDLSTSDLSDPLVEASEMHSVLLHKRYMHTNTVQHCTTLYNTVQHCNMNPVYMYHATYNVARHCPVLISYSVQKRRGKTRSILSREWPHWGEESLRCCPTITIKDLDPTMLAKWNLVACW